MEVGAGREEGEAAAAPVAGRRGCIRSTQGPWTVRRRGRGGGLTTSLRHPTPRERENNRQRERRRRQVAARIYAGLRAHAGYTLPKHADQNDVLRALCAEAGYHVDDGGNVTRLQVDHSPVSLVHRSRFLLGQWQENVLPACVQAMCLCIVYSSISTSTSLFLHQQKSVLAFCWL